jgi:hypothetical protein
MDYATLERVRAEAALMDLSPPVEERHKRFRKAEEDWFESMQEFLEHRPKCAVCRQAAH